jgi:tryptophan-rich sensory protein
MHIVNMAIWLIGSVVFLVALMWGVSQITAMLLMAYLGWKNRR